MSEHDGDEGGLEGGLRWLGQRIARTIDGLENLDVDKVVRALGLDPDRVQEQLDHADEWLNNRAGSLSEEAAQRLRDLGGLGGVGGLGGLGGLSGAVSNLVAGPTGVPPHPRDLPTDNQGRALGAIDSGRWAVEPGSHTLIATGDDPAPSDSQGLVGELRARDWINAAGEVTLVGRDALRRWLEHPAAE